MKGKRLLPTVLLSICLLLTFVGLPFAVCAQPAPPREETIPIGVIQPLTGPGAPWGMTCLRGAEMAVEYVNKKGITVKEVTYKFKIIPEDDKYFADKAVDRLKKLIEKDRIGLVYGSLGSASSLAMAPICAANKVIHFFGGFDTNVITGGNTYSFMMSTTPLFQAQGYAEFLAQNISGIHTVVLVYVNDATGQFAVQAYEPVSKKKGWVVRTEGFERGIVEFGPLCIKVFAAKPQLVWLMGTAPGDSHKIIKGLREFGYRGPVAHAGAVIMDELYRILGDNIGVVYHGSGTGEKPYSNDDFLAFYSEYLKRYGGKEVWNTKSLEGYSFIRMYAKAVEQAQTLDSTVIRDLLATPGKEWYHLNGNNKSYCITEQIAKEVGLDNNRIINVAWQISTWDNVAKKQVNAGWLYPYGWPGGKIPK